MYRTKLNLPPDPPLPTSMEKIMKIKDTVFGWVNLFWRNPNTEWYYSFPKVIVLIAVIFTTLISGIIHYQNACYKITEANQERWFANWLKTTEISVTYAKCKVYSREPEFAVCQAKTNTSQFIQVLCNEDDCINGFGR